MKLEDEINQKKFKSETQKLIINMLYTSNWLERKMKNFFDDAELTPQQYNVLRILRGSKESLSTNQIRERMLDKMSDASRIVDRLIVKNLATKKTHSSDKRLVQVEITKKGLKLLENLDPKILEMEAGITGLTKTESATMNALLDKMRNVKK
ncbi:MAG: MarR family transcriptional regulator [Bacteroidota bacterium]